MVAPYATPHGLQINEPASDSATPPALLTTSVVALQVTTENVPLFAACVNPEITTERPGVSVGEKVPVYAVVPLDALATAVNEEFTVPGFVGSVTPLVVQTCMLTPSVTQPNGVP